MKSQCNFNGIGLGLGPIQVQWPEPELDLRHIYPPTCTHEREGVVVHLLWGKTVPPVWRVAMQDPCILGLDVLQCTGCQLDLARGVIGFIGTIVYMAPANVPYTRPPKLVWSSQMSPPPLTLL